MTETLSYYRHAAKRLRKAYDAGETTAVTRMAQLVETSRTSLKYAHFLHIVAKEHGFESWPRLKLAVDMHQADRTARQQRLAEALFAGQGWAVRALLAQDPEIADGHAGLLAALYQFEKLEILLTAQPARISELVGGKSPIVQLAFSKHVNSDISLQDALLRTAGLLLSFGADANDALEIEDQDHSLSILYGAIGHCQNMALAKLLLEYGADPNDGESLYHATELGHHEGLKLLIEHGANPEGTNALLHAIDFHDHEAVRLLLSVGAHADDYNSAAIGGEASDVIPALHQAARRMSDREMVDLLIEGGADPHAMHEGCSVYAYARIFANQALLAVLESLDVDRQLTDVEQLLSEAAEGADLSGQYLDVSKVPFCYRTIMYDLLSLPEKLDHMKRLIAIGIEWDLPESQHGLTPVQKAGWEGLPDIMGYFLSLQPDLSHVNTYGGTLLTSILHGAEHCPERTERDHRACLELALEQGVALPRSVLDTIGREDLRCFLLDWAERRPGQVIA